MPALGNNQNDNPNPFASRTQRNAGPPRHFGDYSFGQGNDDDDDDDDDLDLESDDEVARKKRRNSKTPTKSNDLHQSSDVPYNVRYELYEDVRKNGHLLVVLAMPLTTAAEYVVDGTCVNFKTKHQTKLMSQPNEIAKAICRKEDQLFFRSIGQRVHSDVKVNESGDVNDTAIGYAPRTLALHRLLSEPYTTKFSIDAGAPVCRQDVVCGIALKKDEDCAFHYYDFKLLTEGDVVAKSNEKEIDFL